MGGGRGRKGYLAKGRGGKKDCRGKKVQREEIERAKGRGGLSLSAEDGLVHTHRSWQGDWSTGGGVVTGHGNDNGRDGENVI